MKQMGHSRSVLVRRESVPLRRAASLPSPMRRRICFGSHWQEGYSLKMNNNDINRTKARYENLEVKFDFFKNNAPIGRIQ